MERISAAVAAYGAGDRDGASLQLAGIWTEIQDGDPLHRCFLAHYMADLQDDVRDELRWDLRALQAADEVTARGGQSLDVRALYPSLHLNLGDDYRRLGAAAQAREHLTLAQGYLPNLPDDGYGQMIRNGIATLGRRLGVPSQSPARSAG
jgi:hypothetical protein